MENKKRYIKPEAVKKLENAVLERTKKQFPNFPYPPKTKFRDDTANGLTECVMTYIELAGGQSERINSTGQKIKTLDGEKWIKGSSDRGTADISATIKGKSVKIEIKIGADKQSEYQKSYQERIEQAGGIYIIVKDFTQFVELCHQKFGSHE
jgi:hypothetical protein